MERAMAFRSWLGATNQLPAAVDERLAFETSTAQITFSWFFENTKGIRFPEKLPTPAQSRDQSFPPR
jgi:hypothetical protein